MKIYFLRHGIAADREGWTGSDGDRPLTDEGIEKMRREAKAIASVCKVDAIVTSPLARAKQTAEIVANQLEKRVTEDERLSPGFNAKALNAIAHDYAGSDAIMLVGHEPDMSETIGTAIGGAAVDLKKGGLALVEFPNSDARGGTLQWLLPPKVIART